MHFENFTGCPNCLGLDYAQSILCSFCGKLIKGEYVELKDNLIACDDCYVIKDLEDLQ